MEKKLTKKEMFGLLLGLLETTKVAEKEELVAFVEHEVELIDKKAEKAKGYKRKKAEDTLKDDVAACLCDHVKLTADVVAELADKYEDLTAAKVTARLTALVKDGAAVKEEVKVDGRRKLMGYRLA